MRVRGRAIALAALVSSGVASAQGVSPPTEPLYPEILVATDDSYSSEPELDVLRARAMVAGKAQVRTGWGSPYDPLPMLDLMSEEVEVFVGQGRRSYRQDFVSLGLHGRETAMELIGRLAYPREGGDPTVKRRYAMQAIGAMLKDPVVGATPWLAGRICTASYGKVPWPDWMALSKKLRYGETEWVIAVEAMIDKEDRWQHADPAWPKRFQLVPVSPEQKASAGSLGVLSPQGAVFFFDTVPNGPSSHFASYLNDHLCFEKRDGSWKITAVALRLEE